MRYLDTFVRGGIMMWPILICFIVACGLVVNRAFAFRRVEPHAKKFLSMVRTLALRRDTKAVVAYCGERKSGLALMIQEAASHVGQGEAKVREVMEGTAGMETQRLERHLPLLALTSSLAPMFGLLGTVLGLILSLHAVEIHPITGSGLLAARLGAVLLPLAFGLGVWIPLFAIHAYFVAGARRACRQMESAMVDVVRWLKEPLPEETVHAIVPSMAPQGRKMFSYDDDEYFRKKSEVKTH
jgi:biopolymer transport protein ExbB